MYQKYYITLHFLVNIQYFLNMKLKGKNDPQPKLEDVNESCVYFFN